MPPHIRARAMEHIEELARARKVRVHWVKSRWKAEAHVTTRQVWIPRIRSGIDYLIALHEFGHICCRRSRRAADNEWSRETEMISESAAWAWAVEQIAPGLRRHLKDDDWDWVASCLLSYLVPSKRHPKV